MNEEQKKLFSAMCDALADSLKANASATKLVMEFSKSLGVTGLPATTSIKHEDYVGHPCAVCQEPMTSPSSGFVTCPKGHGSAGWEPLLAADMKAGKKKVDAPPKKAKPPKEEPVAAAVVETPKPAAVVEAPKPDPEAKKKAEAKVTEAREAAKAFAKANGRDALMGALKKYLPNGEGTLADVPHDKLDDLMGDLI